MNHAPAAKAIPMATRPAVRNLRRLFSHKANRLTPTSEINPVKTRLPIIVNGKKESIFATLTIMPSAAKVWKMSMPAAQNMAKPITGREGSSVRRYCRNARRPTNTAAHTPVHSSRLWVAVLVMPVPLLPKSMPTICRSRGRTHKPRIHCP